MMIKISNAYHLNFTNRENHTTSSEKMWNEFLVVDRRGIAYISNVAVRESFRRKGLAKRLIAKAEAKARAWGCRAIALHCDLSNPGATKLYTSQGFKIIKIPDGANWPHPRLAADVQFNFMMKLLDSKSSNL